ncbi:MAG: transposase family protein, partial [Candidatus Nitrosocosmicus sp.]
PYKKKKDQELSVEEKEYNSIHSKKKRIVIEHTIICRLKKYRIIADVFRNKLRKYDKISDIVYCLT